MPDPYTHDFKVEIDGSFIRGEVEFNSDGKASFRMHEWSEPLSLEILGKFQTMMEWCKEVYQGMGEIKRITIKKKE